MNSEHLRCFSFHLSFRTCFASRSHTSFCTWLATCLPTLVVLIVSFGRWLPSWHHWGRDSNGDFVRAPYAFNISLQSVEARHYRMTQGTCGAKWLCLSQSRSRFVVFLQIMLIQAATTSIDFNETTGRGVVSNGDLFKRQEEEEERSYTTYTVHQIFKLHRTIFIIMVSFIFFPSYRKLPFSWRPAPCVSFLWRISMVGWCFFFQILGTRATTPRPPQRSPAPLPAAPPAALPPPCWVILRGTSIFALVSRHGQQPFVNSLDISKLEVKDVWMIQFWVPRMGWTIGSSPMVLVREFPCFFPEAQILIWGIRLVIPCDTVGRLWCFFSSVISCLFSDPRVFFAARNLKATLTCWSTAPPTSPSLAPVFGFWFRLQLAMAFR